MDNKTSYIKVASHEAKQGRVKKEFAEKFIAKGVPFREAYQQVAKKYS